MPGGGGCGDVPELVVGGADGERCCGGDVRSVQEWAHVGRCHVEVAAECSFGVAEGHECLESADCSGCVGDVAAGLEFEAGFDSEDPLGGACLDAFAWPLVLGGDAVHEFAERGRAEVCEFGEAFDAYALAPEVEAVLACGFGVDASDVVAAERDRAAAYCFGLGRGVAAWSATAFVEDVGEACPVNVDRLFVLAVADGSGGCLACFDSSCPGFAFCLLLAGMCCQAFIGEALGAAGLLIPAWAGHCELTRGDADAHAGTALE